MDVLGVEKGRLIKDAGEGFAVHVSLNDKEKKNILAIKAY